MVESTSWLRKRANTRVRLEEAATEVFLEKGFTGAKIDDVVKKAGFTRGAFYSNFASMEELLLDVIKTRTENLLREISAAVESMDDPPSIEAIMGVLDAIRPEGRDMYILTTEYTLYRMRHPEANEIAAAQREYFSQALAQAVDRVLERMGRHAMLPAVKIADVLVMFFLDWIASENVREDGGQSRELLRHVVELLVVGMSEPVGGDGGPGESSGGNLCATSTAEHRNVLNEVLRKYRTSDS